MRPIETRGLGRVEFQDLLVAVESLRENATWRELLAENLFWASMEGFLQSSLLGAFNMTSSTLVADRERSLGPIKPDLLVVGRDDASQQAWWNARRGRGKARRLTFRQYARAVIQLKVAWTAGCASGSATISNKARAVARDVRRLRGLAGTDALRLIGVLVSGGHREAEGQARIRAALDQVQAEVARAVSPGVEIPLLDCHRPPRWAGLSEPGMAVFSSLWLAPVLGSRYDAT